jgi:hypothetical protein
VSNWRAWKDASNGHIKKLFTTSKFSRWLKNTVLRWPTTNCKVIFLNISLTNCLLLSKLDFKLKGLERRIKWLHQKIIYDLQIFKMAEKHRVKMADNQPSSDFLEYLFDYLFPMVQIRCQIEGLGKTHQMTISKNCLQPPNFQNGRKTCEKSTFSCFF